MSSEGDGRLLPDRSAAITRCSLVQRMAIRWKNMGSHGDNSLDPSGTAGGAADRAADLLFGSIQSAQARKFMRPRPDRVRARGDTVDRGQLYANEPTPGRSESVGFSARSAEPWGAERSGADVSKKHRLSSRSQARAGVSDAVLVNATAFERRNFLQGKTGAISFTTKICTLPFGGMGRSDDGRSVIGIARIQCPRTRWHKRQEKHGNNEERLLIISHGSAP